MNKRKLAAASLFALLVASGGGMVPARAQEPGQGQPVLLTADQIEHDEAANVVTAIGNVEVAQEDRVLRADKVVYDMGGDRMFAYGNVVLVEPSGEVMFAEQAEVTGDLKTGIAEDLLVLMIDESRMAANVGRRTGGVVTELEQASYTACQPCRDNPDWPLMWELKSKQIVHDKATHDIYFYNTWLEMLGVPVAYTPWLSVPDPTVERRSGFMAPVFGSDSSVGYSMGVPYYWAISPYQDMIITPRIALEQWPILALEHRIRFTFGEIRTDASITADEDGDWRGHIRGTGRFNLDETWRAGYDLGLTSDETYLKRYDFTESSLPFLTNRGFVEGFGVRSYAMAESYYLLTQRTGDDQGQVPIIGPLLQYNYVGTPGVAGGRWGLDANLVALTRTDGRDSTRLYVYPHWTLPYTSPLGDVTTLTVGMTGVMDHFSETDRSDTDVRLVPEASIEWRFPFVRLGDSVTQVIEPVIQGVVAPHWTDDDDNADVIDFAFTDTSIFTLHHYAGYDAGRAGPRINYGLRYSVEGWGNGYAQAMIGQSWRAYTDDGLSDTEDNLSDIVGSVMVTPTSNIDLTYRFMLDSEDGSLLRNEVTAFAGPSLFKLGVDYTWLDESVSTLSGEEGHEVTFTANSAVSQHWSVSGYSRHDLTEDGGLLYYGGGVQYEDECFLASLSYVNNFTSDEDLEEGHSVVLRFVFKTLGEAPISIN